MKTSEIIKWYFAIAFLVWFGLAAAYGGAHTEVRQSPLYNTAEEEVRAAFVHLPIFALLWPLWAVFAYGVLEWLPARIFLKFKKT